jgi:acetate kinase
MSDQDHPSKAGRRILASNGGSSSIKFALFATSDEVPQPQRIAGGQVERVGQPGTTLVMESADGQPAERRPVTAANHQQAAEQLIDGLVARLGSNQLTGIGHRIVHGGTKLLDHQLFDDAVLAELKQAIPLDPSHLPREIALAEAFSRRFPNVPQVACFDTAFHRDLPRAAALLPIPRPFLDAGVRRFGFHGLSYTYLLDELRRIAPREAEGRVVFAHLGSGASMAAVAGGRPIDTSMSFTPTAGLVMGTRPGDLDPGLLVYLMREQKFTPEQLDDWLNHDCGLLGVSAFSADVRDLLGARQKDTRAAEAIELFCYQARKWIGAFAAAMGGIDALVFSAGIGERSPDIRAEICAGLEHLGVRLDLAGNRAVSGEAASISAHDSRVAVRVIPTDEEVVIARIVSEMVQGEAENAKVKSKT